MFKDLSLERKMLLAFLFMGAIVLIVALVGASGNARLNKHIDTLNNHSLPSVIGLWKIKDGQTQVQSSGRALLDPKTNSESRQIELNRMENAWQQVDEGFKQYETTSRTDEEDKIYKELLAKWDRLKKDHEEIIQLYAKFQRVGIFNPFERQLELLRQGKDNSSEMAAAKTASNIYNQIHDRAEANRFLFDALTDSILEDLKLNEEQAAQAERAASQDVTKRRFWVVLCIIVGPITAGIFGIYFSNTITRPLGAKIASVVGVAERISAGDLTTQVEATGNEKDEIGKLLAAFRHMTQDLNSLISQVQHSGIQITTSTTQIAASGKQLEATMTEQVASTNEVVATAKEIAATSGELVNTMYEVAATAQETATSAGSSQKDLGMMESTMRQLSEATVSISSKLGVISEKAHNINSVVTTITKVADQTNLLSLNAAIEAEKAGEYGRGFAVVAREIRRLADQTAVATLDIEQMVKEMQSAVSTGVMEMDKFTKEVWRGVEDVRNISAQLAKIIQQVQDLTPRFEMVNQGMEAQSQGAQQISEAMVQLREASIQTADSLRETNRALEQLNSAASGLRQEVSHFKVNSELARRR